MPKKNRAASLVRYGKIESLGWRRGHIVTSKNGRVKSDAMIFAGKEYPISASSNYQIRHYNGNSPVYVTVGSDYDIALSTLARFTASRQLEAANAALGIITPKPAETPKTLAEQLAEYLAKKKSPSLDLSATSIHLYTTTLTTFVPHCGRVYASEVTEGDVVSFIDRLQSEGYGQKSRVMRYVAIRGFLRSCGVQVEKVIDAATHKRLSTKPDDNTDPYTQAELDRFFAACDDEYQLIFTFLLSTGLRFREASHLTWSNVAFDRNVITIPGRQRVNRQYRDRKTGKMVNKVVEFKTKSRKGREVPLFESLRGPLLNWRKQHPNAIYVFGTWSDLPNGHWLEYGKRFWKAAGLNCGVCDRCASKHNECEGFYLHKFRHTYAHRCLDSGISIHKVCKWMGHHSIEVTAKYLSGGSYAADRDPFASQEAA